MSDMPGQDNIAFFVDGALMETISFADITVSAIVSSASSRTDDIGVVWNGRLTLSGSDIHITGVGGSGGAGGNIGILFSGGELICGSGYNPSSFTLEGSGSGTEGDNAGVVFGASFLGVDGSNAGLGSCDLLVVGTGSDDGTTSDNDGIRFEGDFTSDSVNSVFEGIGKGDASHGIYMGPSVITFGITTDSITLNGTAENSNSFGVLCNNCDLVSVNGDITFLGESPLDSNSIAFTSGFDHPTKDAGEFTFEDFTHVVGGFSLDGETDLHFNGGVRFADGTVVIDVDDVDLLVSTYLTGSDLSMTVRGFPIVVSGTLSNDADTDVTFQRNILALGDVTFLTHGEMTFERDIRGDFFEILTDLTITGSGDAYVNSDATGFDNILIDVDGFTFESGGLVFDAFTELEFDTTINFSSGASNGPVLLIANETVTIGDDIMGTAPVTLRIAAETIIFSDGLYSLSSGMIILQESLFLIIDEQRGYEAPRWSAMVPTFGDFVAELAGTFSTQVIVRGSMSALASGSFTSLDMEENSFLKPGSMLTGTGCFTCADLTMAHGSTLVANIDGGVGLSGGCNNLYDRIDVSNSFVISGGSVALDVTATANTVRGNEYAIVADPVTSSGTFSGFPEGSVIGSTPALVLSYVGGSGTSFTLRANELPVPQDDMYTFVAPFSLPAPGILANDTDPDMGTLSVASFSSLSPDDESCTVNRDLDGSLTATGSCIGTYTFSYDVTDGQETAGPATVTLNGILPSPSPTQTPTETTTPTSTSSLSSTTSLSPTATPPPSNSASPTTTATSTPSSTSSTTTTASATQTGTATATSTRTATKSATSTSSATNSPTSTGSSTSSVSPTASMTPSTTMTITATTTPSETSSQTPSTTASPTSTGSSTVTPSRTDSQTTTQSLGASASKTPTKSQSKTPTLSSSKSPTRTPSATRTTSKTGSGSKTSTPSPSSTRSQSSSPSATKSSQPTPSPTRTPSKTPSNTVTPTASLSQGSTPSATATTSSSESASATTSPTASSSATASASLSATQTGSASPTSTETPSSTTSATGSASASLSPTATASEAMASPTNTRAAASATASPTPIVPSAIPSHSRAAASASSGAEAPQAPSASRSRSRSQAGGAIVLPSTVPNPSASICIGAFCVPPNAAPAPNDIPLEVEILPEGTETIKEVRNQEGKEVGRVTVPGDSGGAVLVVNQASSDVRLVEEVVTDVVDVTIVDGSGNVLDTFDGDDLEVCFSTEDFDTDDVCLGFYNDDGTWECQDYCLSTTSGTDGEDLLCGNTPHLTNFALLLSDEAGSESRCGSSSIDYLFVYLSVAAVCLAMIIVFIAVAARESYLRYDIYQTDKRLTYNGSSGRGLGSGGSGSEGLASFSTD